MSSGQLLPITAVTSGLTTVITPSPIVQITGTTNSLLGDITITGGIVTVVQGATGVSLSSSGITITGLPSGTVNTQLLPDSFLPYNSSRSLGGFGLPNDQGGILSIGGGNISIDSLLFTEPNIAIQYPAILNNTTSSAGGTGPATYTTLVYPEVIIPINKTLVVGQAAGLNQVSAVLLDISNLPCDAEKSKKNKCGGCASPNPNQCPTGAVYQIYADLAALGLTNQHLTSLFQALTLCPACPQPTVYQAYQCGKKVRLPDPTVVTDVISGASFIANGKLIAILPVGQPSIVASNFAPNVVAQWVGTNPIDITIPPGTFTIPISYLQANQPNVVPTYQGLQVTFSGVATFANPTILPLYQIFYAILAVSPDGQTVQFTLINPPLGLATITVDNSTPIRAIYVTQ